MAISGAGTRTDRTIGTRTQVLFLRRHGPLPRPPEDFCRLRGQLSLRRAGHALSRSADVVFGGELRLQEPPAGRGPEAAGGPAAPACLPVPARGKGGSGGAHRPILREAIRSEGPGAVQRGRLAGHRGLAEAGAELYRQEPDVRFHGRVSRHGRSAPPPSPPATATAAATATSATAPSLSFIPTASAASMG